ncbi:hypothetical protein, partial [Microcoleus sp. herbarium12]|uniref:hypothetical protein n=1 Tax=Microcoleus sp. herbarium12 TaxID=3055437 RepID=UPI002FD525CF
LTSAVSVSIEDLCNSSLFITPILFLLGRGRFQTVTGQPSSGQLLKSFVLKKMPQPKKLYQPTPANTRHLKLIKYEQFQYENSDRQRYANSC